MLPTICQDPSGHYTILLRGKKKIITLVQPDEADLMGHQQCRCAAEVLHRGRQFDRQGARSMGMGSKLEVWKLHRSDGLCMRMQVVELHLCAH
jgi:hypothetical protein